MNRETIDLVTTYCFKLFSDKKEYELPEEYHYSHLPLCVIDSIFSIGVNYTSVKNTISRFCNYYNIEKFSSENEITTSQALELLKPLSIHDITELVFGNRQRTSTRNGILKSEAVLMFLQLLKKYKIERISDVQELAKNKSFEIEIRHIPGQGSGISYKYFFMLAGSDDLIKPDRMIIRFLESVLNRKVGQEECQIILTEATQELVKLGFNITPKKLDNMIWNYQRAL